MTRPRIVPLATELYRHTATPGNGRCRRFGRGGATPLPGAYCAAAYRETVPWNMAREALPGPIWRALGIGPTWGATFRDASLSCAVAHVRAITGLEPSPTDHNVLTGPNGLRVVVACFASKRWAIERVDLVSGEGLFVRRHYNPKLADAVPLFAVPRGIMPSMADIERMRFREIGR